MCVIEEKTTLNYILFVLIIEFKESRNIMYLTLLELPDLPVEYLVTFRTLNTFARYRNITELPRTDKSYYL